MSDHAQQQIEVRRPTREEFLKYVVPFDDLHGDTVSYPTSHLPGCKTVVKSVVGGGTKVPDGQIDPLPHPSVVPGGDGYKLSFVEASPGNGSTLHWHDTAETFLILEGRWRLTYAGAQGEDSVLLGPRDTVAVPPNVFRGFECIEAAPGKEVGLMSILIIGDTPSSVLSQESVEWYAEHGVTFPYSGVYATPDA